MNFFKTSLLLAAMTAIFMGVGYLILQAEGTFDINTVFAGILVLTAFALALDGAVGAVERRLMTWQPRASETDKV